MLGCDLDDLPGAREALSLEGANPDGYPPLLDAIGAHYGVSADRVATGGGCTGANFLAMAAVLEPGDGVLMEKPYYDQLVGSARLLGAEVRCFERRFEDGYQLDADVMRATLPPRVKLIILSNPHNPSGALLDDESVRQAAAVARDAGAMLLVDEVYLDVVNFTGTGTRYTPAALLASNAISTSSLTKSYGLNALRCGWTIASPEITTRIRRARDVVDGAGAVPLERLSRLAFEHLTALRERAQAIVTRNLDVFRLWAVGVKELELGVPIGATVAFPRVRGSDDTRRLAEDLRRVEDVAVVPGHFFGEPQNIRISLAGRPDVLKEGLDRLAAFLRA